MRNIITSIIILLLSSLFIIANCEAENAIIKDVRGEIFEDKAQIVVEANCEIDYVDYTLENPPRLIIDPIGKVYTDLKDVITFDSGPVKQVVIMKGKPEEGLSGDFYPLDFISIELTSPPKYQVRREIRQAMLIVDIDANKPPVIAKTVTEPVKEEAPAKQEVIEPLPSQEEVSSEQILPEIKIVTPPKTEGAKVEPLTEVQKPEVSEPIPLPTTETVAEGKAEPVSAPEPIKMVYTIGEGDSLDVSVWQHPELDKKIIVRPDGYISFPLAGDVKAVDKTPPQLASDIKEILSRLIKDPQVTVIVLGFGSKNIFVLGEVTKPGSYAYRGGVNVLDAISLAGGWKNSAVLNSVMVVRKAFTDAPEAHRLDVYALVKKGDFSQNLMLEPGDIIYVPKSFIANIGGFIENLRITVGAYLTNSSNIFN